jgi:hypothetical protein
MTIAKMGRSMKNLDTLGLVSRRRRRAEGRGVHGPARLDALQPLDDQAIA